MKDVEIRLELAKAALMGGNLALNEAYDFVKDANAKWQTDDENPKEKTEMEEILERMEVDDQYRKEIADTMTWIHGIATDEAYDCVVYMQNPSSRVTLRIAIIIARTFISSNQKDAIVPALEAGKIDGIVPPMKEVTINRWDGKFTRKQPVGSYSFVVGSLLKWLVGNYNCRVRDTKYIEFVKNCIQDYDKD